MFKNIILGIGVCLFFCSCSVAGIDFADIKGTSSADGVRVAYSEYGQGDTALVLVHGWSCDSRYWNKQIEYFAKKYKLITIDLAGHGNSGTNRNVFSFKSFAQDVAAVLDATGTKKAILIGHSMGGSVALQTAMLMPNQVIGVIGVDTLQDMGHKASEEEKAMYLNPMKEDFKTNVDKFVRSMFPANANKKLVDQVAGDMSSADKRIALSAITEYFKDSAEGIVTQLTIPIKCLNADMWPTNIERNKLIAKDYELSLMKGYGHFIMLEDPVEFNKKLEALIEAII